MRTLLVLMTGCIAVGLAQLVPELPPHWVSVVTLSGASLLAIVALLFSASRQTPLLIGADTRDRHLAPATHACAPSCA